MLFRSKPFTVSSPLNIGVYDDFSGVSYAANTYQIAPSSDYIPPEYRCVAASYFVPQTLFINRISINGEWYIYGFDVGTTRSGGYVSISLRGLYSGNSDFQMDMPSYIQRGGYYMIYPYSPYTE